MAEILSERKKILQLGPEDTELFNLCRICERLEQPYENKPEDAVIWYRTVQFGDQIEADVKLCNGDTGPWMEMVVFQDGSELANDPSDVSFGEFAVDYDGERFIVDVVAFDGSRQAGVYDA